MPTDTQENASSADMGRPLSHYLFLLIFTVLLPAIATGGILISGTARADRERANREAVQLARSIAAAIDREIEGSNESLRALASSPALRTGDFETFYNQMRAALQSRKRNALLSDLEGQQIVNTRAAWGTPLPKTDPKHNGISEVIATREPAVSNLLIGAVAKKWVIAFNVPVAVNGQLKYVLTMSIDPDQIESIVNDEKLDPGWVAVVTDRQERIIARSTSQAQFVGQLAGFDASCSDKEGAQRKKASPGSGALMVQGFRCLDQANWRVTTFVSADVIDAPFRKLWWNYLAMASAFLAASLPLAFFVGQLISRPIAASAGLANRLGGGEQFDIEPTPLLETNVVNQALSRASKDLAARNKSLAENESRFRAVFDQAVVGFEQISLDGNFLGLNDRLCKLLGYTREECLEKSFRTFTCPLDLDQEERHLSQLMTGDVESYAMEKRLIHKNGDKVWVRVTSSLVRDQQGRPLYRSSVVEDVGEARQQRLQAAQLAAIVEASPDAMLNVDLDGRVSAWNPGAEALFGFSGAEMIGAPLIKLVPEAQHGDVATALHRVRRGETIKRETRKSSKSGALVDVAATYAPIRSKDGMTVTAISITMEDIRDRRKREAQVSLLNRELAHRVKNSLAVVQSLVNQTVRTSGSIEEFRLSFQGRLQALAAATDLLTQTNWGTVDLRDFAVRVLRPILTHGSDQLHLKGQRQAILPPDLSVPIGLALYELGTNALKYGAWSVPQGFVDLDWHIEKTKGRETLVIEWTERNGPTIDAAPSRTGFGSVLIDKGIPGATVQRNFLKTGVVCRMEIRLHANGESA